MHRAAFQNDLILLFALPSLPRSALKVAVAERASENAAAAAAVEESAGAQRLEETLSGDQREGTEKKPF